MLYYKNKHGNVFAYESEDEYRKFGLKDVTLMTSEEVAAHEAGINSASNVAAERRWRNYELQKADVELYKVQDTDSKSTGTVSQWRDYRKALRAWPENPDFPNKDKRPLAPDA